MKARTYHNRQPTDKIRSDHFGTWLLVVHSVGVVLERARLNRDAAFEGRVSALTSAIHWVISCTYHP